MKNLDYAIRLMVNLRLFPLYYTGFLLICCLLFFICYLADNSSRRNVQMARLPLVQNFISQNSRRFDPSRDEETINCAICLEDFIHDENKLVAELNCSQKHIFHAECLKSWIERNDICPMCREPIIKD